jgi:two-component system, cell cycle response regulator DivK
VYQKILIVEDNDKNRELVRDILAFQGYRVFEAKNGAEGVAMTKEHKPDLVIMDIQMPVMDGITAAKIIKNDPSSGGITMIALTSFAMKGDRERFMEAGFDDYIAKPIDTRTLPAIVKKCVEKKRVEPARHG